MSDTAKSSRHAPATSEAAAVTDRSHTDILRQCVVAIDTAAEAIRNREPHDTAKPLAVLAASLDALTHLGRAPLAAGVVHPRDDQSRQEWAKALDRWQAGHDTAISQTGGYSDGRSNWARSPVHALAVTSVTPDQWAKITAAIDAVIELIGTFWGH